MSNPSMLRYNFVLAVDSLSFLWRWRTEMSEILAFRDLYLNFAVLGL